MTREESIVWLESLKTMISQHQYRNLWNYEQALTEAIELLQSDRLIELPCNVGGGEIYVLNRGDIPQIMILNEPDIRCHCPKEGSLCRAMCDEHAVCAYRLKNDGSDIGKRVFRTKEEAEKAMMNNKEN